MDLGVGALLYSYIRFSTMEQEKGHSFSRQMAYAKEVAKEKGLELDQSLTMQDKGLSAYHKDNITRGALGVFLEAIEKGKVPRGSVLVIESLDRISRAEPIESQGVIAQIINAGITVITATDRKEYNKESIKENPMDLVYIILVLIRANEESEIKSKRVRSALVEQCEKWQNGEKGFRVKCGKPPKWVAWDEKKKEFVFVPREKEIMERKIELFKRGFGGLKIAEMINREYGENTIHHTGANVYKEVKRRSLVGELHVNVGGTDYVLNEYFPAILKADELDLLIADSKKRGATKYRQKFVGILSGIDVFKCGCCTKSVGTHVVYRNENIGDVKSSHKRYGCVEARRNNNCSMKRTIQVDVVEKAVVRFCQDKVNLRRILLKDSDRDSIYKEEARLKERLIKVSRDIDLLTEALLSLTDEPPKAIANKIKSLEVESNEIEEALLKNRNKLTRIDNTYRDEVTERWLSLTENLAQLQNEERMKIRQLAKDTFKSITLMVENGNEKVADGIAGMIESNLFGFSSHNYFDLTLEFHNGKKRLLRLDKHTGYLYGGFDLE